MKTIEELACIGSLYYSTLIESYGLEIVEHLRLGSYQGDLLFIVRNDEGKFGLITTGYGSCSGCDVLQAAIGYEWDYETERHIWSQKQKNNILELRERLCAVHTWREAGEMIEYLSNKDWKIEYYGEDEELKPWIEKCKETILIRGLAKF